MKFDDLTIGEAKKLAAMFSGQALPKLSETSVEVGKMYAFRSVTHYYTGKVEAITDTDFVLSGAAWIADTGRWTAFLRDPTSASEVELFTAPCILMRGGIIDASEVKALPFEQK